MGGKNENDRVASLESVPQSPWWKYLVFMGLDLTSIEQGGKKENDRDASTECVPIQLNSMIILI